MRLMTLLDQPAICPVAHHQCFSITMSASPVLVISSHQPADAQLCLPPRPCHVMSCHVMSCHVMLMPLGPAAGGTA